MKIRKVARKDVNEIVRLFNSAKELKPGPSYRFDREYVSGHFNNPLLLMLVCEENGKIAGAICGEIWGKLHYSFVSNIIVKKEMKGKGYGKKLMAAFISIAKKKNAGHILCLVQETNKNMQAFSKKLGFKRGYKFYFYEKDA